jgi:hypothetical protein
LQRDPEIEQRPMLAQTLDPLANDRDAKIAADVLDAADNYALDGIIAVLVP